jgi:hypothetical protein
MILNLRRIGLYSMSLALILTLSITPISRSEDITPFEEFFKGYEKVWEMRGENTDVYCGDEYFGIFTKTSDNGYKYYHFQNFGELTWEADGSKVNPIHPALSRSGNRIMMLAVIDPHKPPELVVYDTEGNLLQKFPERMYFRSSPTGRYFYSKPDELGEASLIVVNDIGITVLEKPEVPWWNAKALDDSLLIYNCCGALEAIKITEHGVNEDYFVYEKPDMGKYVGEVFTSPNGEFIALKYPRKIYILNKKLHLLDIIAFDCPLGFASFCDDAKILCTNCYTKNREELILSFQSFDDKAGERFSISSPYYLGRDISFSGTMFAVRYKVIIDRNHPEIQPSRSLVVRLSSDYSSIISSAVLDNRIYPIGRFGDLLVINDSTITGWSKKGGK